jgi:hypothetical protein
MKIDLEQFVNKTVIVTLQDGFTSEAVIERSNNSKFPYELRWPDGDYAIYKRDGFYWLINPLNIKTIKLKEEKPVDLRQQLETIQQEAEVIKQALTKSHPTIQDANPGDELEDGCIVIEKYSNAVLIAAPKETEVFCTWTPEFQPVFDKLTIHNFKPSQWFIPSQKQLKLAHKNAKQHFSSSCYWSSTEASSTGACYMSFSSGFQGPFSMTTTLGVRAFMLVEL